MRAILLAIFLLFGAHVGAESKLTCSSDQSKLGCIEVENQCKQVPQWNACYDVDPLKGCVGSWGRVQVCETACLCPGEPAQAVSINY